MYFLSIMKPPNTRKKIRACSLVSFTSVTFHKKIEAVYFNDSVAVLRYVLVLLNCSLFFGKELYEMKTAFYKKVQCFVIFSFCPTKQQITKN